jgi:hypothetical protein
MMTPEEKDAAKEQAKRWLLPPLATSSLERRPRSDKGRPRAVKNQPKPPLTLPDRIMIGRYTLFLHPQPIPRL